MPDAFSAPYLHTSTKPPTQHLSTSIRSFSWMQIFHWERWPWGVFYFPLTFVWAWYCLRSRSFWFFTASNPTLTFGGFEGEGKREMYEQLPADSFPKTVWFLPTDDVEEALLRLELAGFSYPFIVKPEVGMKGLLCRKIETADQFRAYHSICPVEFMAQAFVEYPIELGVFYYRHPAAKTGIISGLTQKEIPSVQGDGESTLLHLMQMHPRSVFWIDELMKRHQKNLNLILPKGVDYPLAVAANRNRGAHLKNLNHLIGKPLTDIFDQISLHGDGQFFYGRFDLKCTSLEDLKCGKNYLILEYNGCGAAPNHIYHCGLSVWQAWGEMIRHWRALFEISRYNHRTKTPYWSFMRGYQFHRKSNLHFKQLEKYDKQYCSS